MKRVTFLIYVFFLTFTFIYGSTLDKAKEYFRANEFEKALPLFKESYKKNPRNASINQWLGVCLYFTGEYDEAQKYLSYANKKRVLKSYYYLGLVDFKKGNLNAALKHIEEYEKRVAKSKTKISDEHELNISRIKSAVNMLDHVEKIVIIDSISVDKKEFFKHYRISPEVGTFKDVNELDSFGLKSINPIYQPESREKILWSAKSDLDTCYTVYQSTKLIDGSWDSPHKLDAIFNDGSDNICPFIKPDGTSVYFASNSENSIGGYDIFVAGKDIESNKFFKPQNMGLPYNSPYNDFLLVYDEINGLGWWATDRNQIEDKLTIYVFIPNDIRSNYSIDNCEIESLAFIRNIKDTWEKDENYESMRERIKEIDTSSRNKKNDFEFIISNDIIYTSYMDFKTQEGKDLMKSLLSFKDQLKNTKIELDSLRKDFQIESNRNNDSKTRILELEEDIKGIRTSINNISNEIRRIENNNN